MDILEAIKFVYQKTIDNARNAKIDWQLKSEKQCFEKISLDNCNKYTIIPLLATRLRLIGHSQSRDSAVFPVFIGDTSYTVTISVSSGLNVPDYLRERIINCKKCGDLFISDKNTDDIYFICENCARVKR